MRNYRAILDTKDPRLIDNLFNEIQQGMIDRIKRSNYGFILERGLREGYPYTARERIISYFLLLFILAIDGPERKYNEYLLDYENYVSGHLADLHKSALVADFGDDDFLAYINIAYFDETKREQLRSLITTMWSKIPD